MTRSMRPADWWQAAYGELQIQLPREAFDTWLRGASYVAYEDGMFIIGVPNAYARDWLQQRLKRVITETLERISERTIEVRFVIRKPAAEQDEQELHEAGPLLSHLAPPEPPRFEGLPPGETGLNPRQSFAGYAVGQSNRLAHAAALAVVEAPGVQFNPMFVRAQVGMGKSHLLHAIGNAAHERGLRVLYVTGETFTNDLMGALRKHAMNDFRGKYREVDVLLVDDVHFIAGKISTQEEFLHTFDTLYNSGAQIVLASALLPSEIKELDTRLSSRFEGGLTVDIAAPDFLTRVDIIEMKAASRGFGGRLSLDAMEVIAERVPGSVRDLEGALNQVIAASLLDPGSLALAGVARTLDAVVEVRPVALTMEDIIMAVADYYDVSAEAMVGRGRSRDVSTARQVAMYLAREEADATLEAIGEAFDGRNHSTVLYSCDRVADLLATDSPLRRQMRAILQALKPTPGTEDAGSVTIRQDATDQRPGDRA